VEERNEYGSCPRCAQHAEYDSVPKSVKGTIAYLAPEVVLAQFNKSNYDGRLSDVWSCGVMLYIMLFGSYPFQDGAHQQFNRTVKAREIPWSNPIGLTQWLSVASKHSRQKEA